MYLSDSEDGDFWMGSHKLKKGACNMGIYGEFGRKFEYALTYNPTSCMYVLDSLCG